MYHIRNVFSPLFEKMTGISSTTKGAVVFFPFRTILCRTQLPKKESVASEVVILASTESAKKTSTIKNKKWKRILSSELCVGACLQKVVTIQEQLFKLSESNKSGRMIMKQ